MNDSASSRPKIRMQSLPLDPPVSDTAPTEPILTAYDEQHLVTYLRLLDAEEAPSTPLSWTHQRPRLSHSGAFYSAGLRLAQTRR
jgi:hypothetical protein